MTRLWNIQRSAVSDKKAERSRVNERGSGVAVVAFPPVSWWWNEDINKGGFRGPVHLWAAFTASSGKKTPHSDKRGINEKMFILLTSLKYCHRSVSVPTLGLKFHFKHRLYESLKKWSQALVAKSKLYVSLWKNYPTSHLIYFFSSQFPDDLWGQIYSRSYSAFLYCVL